VNSSFCFPFCPDAWDNCKFLQVPLLTENSGHLFVSLLKPGELITWDGLWARAKKNLLTRESGFVFRLGQIGDQVAYQPCPSVKIGAAARANRDVSNVLADGSFHSVLVPQMRSTLLL